MANSRRERIIIVSGLKGYFQLLPEEQKAFRIEIFFSATNVGETNYYSYEWYKERSFYGRFKVARGEYTTKEKLLQYQNELIYQEEATLNEIVKRLQCQAQKQYEVNKFLVEATIKIAAAANIVTGFGGGATAFDQIPPQPISIPALQVDGIYYQMFPGCAGNITVQTWYDEELCKDVNGDPLTKDNRGKPPEPASAGKPPAGTDRNVPPPTFPTDQTYRDPSPGSDTPTDLIPNPGDPEGVINNNYALTAKAYLVPEGTFLTDLTANIKGRYGGLVTESPSPGSFRTGIYHSIGVALIPSKGVFLQLTEGGRNPDGAPRVRIELISIVPV